MYVCMGEQKQERKGGREEEKWRVVQEERELKEGVNKTFILKIGQFIYDIFLNFKSRKMDEFLGSTTFSPPCWEFWYQFIKLLSSETIEIHR